MFMMMMMMKAPVGSLEDGPTEARAD